MPRLNISVRIRENAPVCMRTGVRYESFGVFEIGGIRDHTAHSTHRFRDPVIHPPILIMAQSSVEESSTPVVSSRTSPLVPLPAGIWGVKVQPGPDFGDAYHTLVANTGTVLHPSVATEEWCRGATGELDVGQVCDECESHQLGGWYVGRSVAVKWDGDDRVFYYRAGDHGFYDLAWIVPDGFEFDAIAYLQAENACYEYMATRSPSRALQVARCELKRRCGMLQQMLDGETVRTVTGGQ